MEPLELTHLATMQEEGFTEHTLPIEFKPKLMSLQMMLGRYQKSPTEGLKESIERASANLSHSILDFVEKYLPEEDVNADGTPIEPPVIPVTQTVSQPTVDEPPVPPVNQPPVPPVQEAPPPPKAQKSGGIFDFFGL